MDINYSALPNDPSELYTLLDGAVPTVELSRNGNSDQAILAPTAGRESSCAVWIVIVPAERKAYKLLLNHEDLQQFIATANVCCAARG